MHSHFGNYLCAIVSNVQSLVEKATKYSIGPSKYNSKGLEV
jgi:hypothetical protein